NGAPQSINQHRLYGTYAKWFVDVALPEATDAAFRYIRTTAGRSVAAAQAIPPGPVHLNFPFREPLTPEPIPEQILPPVDQRDLIAWQGRPDNAPYIDVHDASPGTPDNKTIGNVLRLINEARRGLIIVGPIDDPILIEPLVRLSQYSGYPILADPLSQLRYGAYNRSMVLASYDAFLRSDSFVESVQPELIIRFGTMPTSKSLLLYLKRYASSPLVVIDGNGGWEEPTQLASQLIHANPTAVCRDLINALEQRQTSAERPSGTPQAWLRLWQDTDKITRQALQHAIYDFEEMFEGRVFSELTHLLEDGTTLYIGNSMPVRDLDTFFWSSERHIRIMGNRGANGIDGVISSTLGASAVASNEPSILVLGDLSFFHDLNGLLAAHLYELNLTIILINNDGGGIFSFLPQAAHPQHFEQLFGTPTGLDFHHVVEMYGGRFHRVENWEVFRKAVNLALHNSGLDVIEILTERTSNVKMHRYLWEVVDQAIANHQ
ncbi:MAG TPA: 2-succinyl-5-enolpyruvyl-6-hydroxy-3-cyclohexene-1-carboxylic-acid synthase, partial [Ktedonobacteraceae bacterium]|nr:2-succinyl-5-enolpyruvyl-6-hydroxy-3-cyclohexene-1-carboxylic-acid synthase [Ktedonobacteraceae bacterium]